MKKTKVFSLVLVLQLFLAACITAKEPQMEEKEMKIVELNDFMRAIQDQNVSFVVAYNKNAANPVVIAPGPDNPKPTPLPTSKPINIQSLEELLGKKLSEERFIELKSTTIFSIYGSPGGQLIITPSGVPIFVTWPQP